MRQDYSRVLDLAISLMTSNDEYSSWQTIWAELMTTLDVSIVGRFEVELSSGRIRATTWPAWTSANPWDEAPHLVTTHPLLCHYADTADIEPRTVTDILPATAWRSSPVYEAAHRNLRGATNQLAIPLLGPPGLLRNVTIGRPGSDFTDQHRTLVRMLQPLLVGFDRQQQTMSSWLRTAPAEAEPQATALGLTRRETAVLALLGTGLTARAIGRRLSITPHTVAKHQQNIYRKLGVHDRLGAVLLARRVGILPDRA